GADSLFMRGLEMAEGSDGARELAEANLLGGFVKALEIAHGFGVPVEQLEAESGGLGMNAVSAADGGRVLEFEGTLFEDFGELHEVLAENFGCGLELEGLCCI